MNHLINQSCHYAIITHYCTVMIELAKGREPGKKQKNKVKCVTEGGVIGMANGGVEVVMVKMEVPKECKNQARRN